MLNSAVFSDVSTFPSAWCGVWKPVVVRWCFWRTCWMKPEPECCATWRSLKVHPKLSMYLTHLTNCMLACLCILIFHLPSLLHLWPLTVLCLHWLSKSFSLLLVWSYLCILLKAVESDGNLRLSAHRSLKYFDAKNALLGSVNHYCFLISHKETGKPRRDGRESGNYCSHHPGELELNATSRHKYSNISLWRVYWVHLWWWVLLTFRISKVPCCQTTRLTGTECCRLRGTLECFCSTHTHDSAGSLSDDSHIIKKTKQTTLCNFVTAAWCGGVKLEKHVTLILPSCSITRASLSCSTFCGQWICFHGAPKERVGIHRWTCN